MGIIMGLILSCEGEENTILHTDHLDSVRFIKDARSSINQESRMRNMNGRLYYRWILDMVTRSRTQVNHTKGHSDAVNIASLMNNEADHYASQSQKFVSNLHFAPIPTF